MDDGGISVTGLTIGGAALTTIGGLVGAWLKARHGRTEITPQPLEVREAPARDNREAREIAFDLPLREGRNEVRLGFQPISDIPVFHSRIQQDGRRLR